MFASSCNADKFSPWPCMGSTAICRWFAALSHERDAVFHLGSYFGKEGLDQPMTALSAHASQFESATVRCYHREHTHSLKRCLTHFCSPQGRPRISSFPPSSWDILLFHFLFSKAQATTHSAVQNFRIIKSHESVGLAFAEFWPTRKWFVDSSTEQKGSHQVKGHEKLYQKIWL